jgi:hypothetical protein
MATGRVLAAHQKAAPLSRVDPYIAAAVERQTKTMRALARRAFPEPDVAADDAPAPTTQAHTERRQAGASRTAALCRARQERAARAAASAPQTTPLGRTA